MILACVLHLSYRTFRCEYCSAMSQRKSSPLLSQKGGLKTNQHLGPSLNWIQCDKCQGWDLFENSGIGGKFNEKVLCSVQFDCRLCQMERRVEGLVGKVREVEETVAEVKERVEKLEVRIGVEITDRMKEAATEVEGKLSAVCDNELGVLRGSVEEIQGRMKDVEVEVDSRVAVGEGRCDEKIGVLERAVGEVKDGLHALGVKVEDLSGDWELVGNRRKERSVAAVNVCAESVSLNHHVPSCSVSKSTYAEVVQNRNVSKLTFSERVKGKGTVFVVGDSLVRGVGKKLETQCGTVFSSRSISGARIEDVAQEVRKLEAREARHLVVLVGTNNIQKDGSEVVLRKFHSLIEGCKAVRNRMVTVVGIPRRFDVTSLQENRRLGVNVRLSRMCREAGVQYVEYEADRSRICADRVHFNALGQSEVAGMIFRHCRHFLL